MSGRTLTKGWEPRDPQNGDFRLQVADGENFDPDDWPATPSDYRPTTHFGHRFREADRVLTGDIINEAISEGKLVPALRDCGAFYATRPGVVYYVVVGWDQESPNPRKRGKRVVVTAWPWVYSRDDALDSGRFSSRTLNRMQEVNQTLFNRHTADYDWLEYFERGVEQSIS